jgi:uncharacterized membrane protein YeaQ/YmgE (transglycosylase-associated protein family)
MTIMANLIFWILFGVLAGWISALATGQGPHRLRVNIIAGVLGAIAGGALGYALLSINEQGISFSVTSLLAAVCGAIILVTLVKTVDRQ